MHALKTLNQQSSIQLFSPASQEAALEYPWFGQCEGIQKAHRLGTSAEQDRMCSCPKDQHVVLPTLKHIDGKSKASFFQTLQLDPDQHQRQFSATWD